MSLDLCTVDAADPDPRWLYAHATLQRLFNGTQDDRIGLWGEVPGFMSVIQRPAIHAPDHVGGDVILDTDIYIETFLLTLSTGRVVILGGTRLLGWPQHVLSAMAPTWFNTGNFPSYWLDLATVTLAALSTIIPSGNSQPIVFNGHSLGGAVAVACAYLDHDRPQSRTRGTVTFGAPKARSVAGMDDRDFPAIRVLNDLDVVPYMPVNPFPVRWGFLQAKWAFPGLFHYGTPWFIRHNRSAPYVNPDCPFPGILATAIGASPDYVVRPHFMHHYAYLLRREMARDGITPDPFWDKANDLCNRIEGEEWDIDSFPAQAATVSPGTPLPTPVEAEVQLTESQSLLTPAMFPVFSPPNLAAQVPDQSLAAFLSASTGQAVSEVTVHLHLNVITDVSNLTPESFVEADYEGYEPQGGALWTKIAPIAGSNITRFARHFNFQATNDEVPNQVMGWHMLATIAGSAEPKLVQWYQGPEPIPFDKAKRGVFLTIELQAG